MDKYLNKLIIVLFFLQLNLHCQMNNKTPEFRTEICHPDNKYDITPVFDKIKTLENIPASLPYGSSSGCWGDSGKSWTEQQGTPIGFDITYYSGYEDKYYQIDEDFDVDYIKEMTSRCYPTSDDTSDDPVKEFIYKKEFDSDFQKFRKDYREFSHLIFGFAPQGMIVVWLGYGPKRIELGRFQALVVTDENRIAVCKEKYMNTYRVDPEYYEEARKKYFIPNVSALQWDNYRLRYNWNYNVTSDNTGFKFLKYSGTFFNGETDDNFNPIVLSPEMKKRAIPEVITLCWETSSKERYQAKLFFDWNKTNLWFKEAKDENVFNIHISEDNSKIEIKLNDKLLELDSIRIYPNSHLRFRDSYKD